MPRQTEKEMAMLNEVISVLAPRAAVPPRGARWAAAAALWLCAWFAPRPKVSE